MAQPLDVKTETTTSDDLDKEAWFPEIITQLTRQGVVDPVAQCVSLLPQKSRKPILRYLEQEIMKEVMTWGAKRQDRFRKKMNRLPRHLRYVTGQDQAAEKRNIAWSGAETWGCSFHEYLLIASIDKYDKIPPLQKLLFSTFNEFVQWVSTFDADTLDSIQLYEGWRFIDTETCPDELRRLIFIARENRIEFALTGKSSQICSIRKWLREESEFLSFVSSSSTGMGLSTMTLQNTGNHLSLGYGTTITFTTTINPPTQYVQNVTI